VISAVHAGDARQLGFEMPNRSIVRIVCVQKTECTPQQFKQFRLGMVAFGAKLDQLDEIGCGLGAQVSLANTGERISQNYFGQGVQVRFSTERNLDFGLEKQIQFASKRTLRAPRAPGHRLDTAQRLGAPGNDQAGIAEFPFSQKNSRRALHRRNLTADQADDTDKKERESAKHAKEREKKTSKIVGRLCETPFRECYLTKTPYKK
jgi:hypothetical protein